MCLSQYELDSTTFILLHLQSCQYTTNRIWRVQRGGTAQANSYCDEKNVRLGSDWCSHLTSSYFHNCDHGCCGDYLLELDLTEKTLLTYSIVITTNDDLQSLHIAKAIAVPQDMSRVVPPQDVSRVIPVKLLWDHYLNVSQLPFPSSQYCLEQYCTSYSTSNRFYLSFVYFI